MSPSAADAPRILTRQEMPGPEIVEVRAGTAAVYSGRSPAKTTENEDGIALVPAGQNRCVLAVADGVGGHAAGAQAATLALQALCESITGAAGDANGLRASVLDGIEAANEKVVALGVGAATTLAIVEIDGCRARPFHVGDSMIVVVGQRGKVKLQTVPHSPVGYAMEAGLLDASDAIHHEDRHLVSNIVGSPEMRIEVGSSLNLRPRDTLVIGSDGLFDNLHVEEILDHVRTGPLARAAARLVGTAHARMTTPRAGRPSKPDDLTFVVFRPHAPPAAGAAPEAPPSAPTPDASGGEGAA
ncbi:MAG: PP2C family protein-serine/threonine phosphatase [Planctomycetota bacterium]